MPKQTVIEQKPGAQGTKGLRDKENRRADREQSKHRGTNHRNKTQLGQADTGGTNQTITEGRKTRCDTRFTLKHLK